jgi:hypothetical protein
MEIKIGIITNDEEYRVGFKKNEISTKFEDFKKDEQIQICNSLLELYELFAPAIKNK